MSEQQQELRCVISDLRTEIKAIRAERDAAVKLAQDYAWEAYQDVEGWSAYASDHFQRRWNLEGDLAKWLERGAAIDAAKEKP